MGRQIVLHGRDDFADLIIQVGQATGAGAAIVEKDYWVTESLRVVATQFADGAIFKGGTSLSKAWGLIRRFSEDIDLLIRTDGKDLGSRGGRDRYMKAIDDAVADVDGLTHAEGSRSERGVSRTVVYEFTPRATAMEGLRATVILEMGIRGGTYPVEDRMINSMLATALSEAGLSGPETEPFPIAALHPRRTFVEKLFAIHSACVLFQEGRPNALTRRARHFYDLYFLGDDSSVEEFVGSTEFTALMTEVDEFGHEYYLRDHRAPPDLAFSNSVALAPADDLLDAIRSDYESSQYLFYGEYPSFDEILSRLGEIRSRL